jgi:RNase P/RNase MRP subunit POP5
MAVILILVTSKPYLTVHYVAISFSGISGTIKKD